MYAITSEDPAKVDKAVAKWKLENTIVMGDPDHTVVKYLEEKYSLKFVIDEKAGYPNGMVQPAELVFWKNRPIVAWIKKSTMKNGKGAIGRPDPAKIWNYVEEAISSGEPDTAKCSNGKEFWSLRSAIM